MIPAFIPTAPAVQINTPQCTSCFRIYVQGPLEQLFYHHIEDGISQHLETYRFLNTPKLEAISDTIKTLEEKILDIGITLRECQDVIAYVWIQLKILCKKYKQFMRTLDHHHKEIATLRAIHSQESKQTCFFEDSKAGLGSTTKST
ncbi:hypothetical protein DFH28DRAFT_1080036 [Melampsora americana]|nr:hypothetical protein DFH28DRAFT_1080036 [Melampsora americana]